MAKLNARGAWLYRETRDMSDSDFEAAIAGARHARQAARETVAYDRAMDVATGGLYSQRHMYEHRSGEDKLIAAYIRAGLSTDEALRKVRELR
jgi:hypothetical protein